MTELTAFNEQRAALAFSDYLRVIGIANHVEPREQRFAIMLKNDMQHEQARSELNAFIRNPNDPKYLQASWQAGAVQPQLLKLPSFSVSNFVRGFLERSGPVTLAVAVVCVLVFIGQRWLGSRVTDELVFPPALTMAGIHGEWWRLLTPVLLHLSAVHVLFSVLWWWLLGGLIERTQSGAQLLGVAVVTALVGNVAQFLAMGPYVAGLSGVVYGLLGYVWLYPKANPAVGFQVRPALVLVMVGFLVLGYSGVLAPVFGDAKTNAAQGYGLITGCALGVLFGLLNRGRAGKSPV